jgi:hypothetical protein
VKESALADALAGLYAAPLDQFVAARREATLRLRAAGEVAASRFIAAAAKPTRTAWALNQVARRRPALVSAMVEAREAAAAAQAEGDASGIREGAKRFRDAVAEVVRAARAGLEQAGLALSPEQTRRMGETLQALAADDVARRTLTAGRLTEDVPVEDPFAGLELPASVKPLDAPAPPPANEPAPARRPRVVETDEAARLARRSEEEAERRREAEERAAREKQRVIDDALAAVTRAEEGLHAARSAADAAEDALARARTQADAARRSLTRAEEDLQRAKAHAKKVGA